MLGLFVAALYVSINYLVGYDLGESTIYAASYLFEWYRAWACVIGIFGIIITIGSIGGSFFNAAWLVAGFLVARNIMACVACHLVQTAHINNEWDTSRLTVATILGIIYVVTRVRWSTNNKS